MTAEDIKKTLEVIRSAYHRLEYTLKTHLIENVSIKYKTINEREPTCICCAYTPHGAYEFEVTDLITQRVFTVYVCTHDCSAEMFKKAVKT